MTLRGTSLWMARRWKYIARMTMAKGTAVPHMMYDMVMVITAWFGSGSTSPTTPPDAAATMGATMNNSQAAVMLSREALW